MSDVQYLAFEGGGGKGAAYLAVMKAIEDYKNNKEENSEEEAFRKQILGVSGASAGAINALTFLLEYTSDEMRRLLLEEKIFMKFIPPKDKPPQSLPKIRGVFQYEGTVYYGEIGIPPIKLESFQDTRTSIRKTMTLANTTAELLRKMLKLTANPFPKFMDFLKDYEEILEEHKDLLNPHALAYLFHFGGLLDGFDVIKTIYQDIILPKLKDKVEDPGEFVRHFHYKWSEKDNKINLGSEFYPMPQGRPTQSDFKPNDSGVSNFGSIFTENPFNKEAQQSFKSEKETVDFLNGGDVKLTYNKMTSITFEMLYEMYFTELVVAGANLSTGESMYFSWRDTPDFPVAIAIAISMNLPLWSPIYLSYVSPHGVDYTGWWFDGGVYNNFPVRVFNADTNEIFAQRFTGANLFHKQLDNRFRGFVLDAKPKFIEEFPPGASDVGAAIFDTWMERSTFSQFLEEETANVVILDIGRLSTYKFDPEEDVINEIHDSNYAKAIEALG